MGNYSREQRETLFFDGKSMGADLEIYQLGISWKGIHQVGGGETGQEGGKWGIPGKIGRSLGVEKGGQ